MELKVVNCPICGGKIEISTEEETVICKYCQTQFYIEENNPERLKSKVRLKEIEHETARVKMALDDKADKRKTKLQGKMAERKFFYFAVMGFFLFLLLLLIGAYAYIGVRSKSLEKTVAEIQEDIDNENFDAARVKVESLRDSEFYGEEKKRWKETRKQLIKQIDEAEKAAIIAKSIAVPAASSKIKGMNYNDVVELFENSGFSNINALESTDKAGLFHDGGDVKEISIGGDDKFKEGDLFLPDTLVTIYYFAE